LAYVERVNHAIDHVLTHLDEPLRLVGVAKAAMLSPFHFHRVFQAMMGLTLADFVKRLRLDKALSLMAQTPRASLTTIALSCGFSSSSDFSRCFKQQFGVAARAFDLESWRSQRWSALAPPRLRRLPPGHNPDGFRARVRALPPRTVAYVRVRNPYRPDAVTQATARLVDWAERQGVAGHPWLGYQWENPELVPLEHCRYHAAVEVEPFRAVGEVGCFPFPAMTVAEVEVRGGIELELRALQWLYGTWLPRSGYVPDDQPCFEAWLGRPFAHGLTHFELRLQLPVRGGA
jgi:AraC family transcriptional regulator